jgi:peptide/nickel transport system permease protein
MAWLPHVNITDTFSDHYVTRNVFGALHKMLQDRATLTYFLFLVFVLVLGVFGPVLAPYDPTANQVTESGTYLKLAEPSLEHPLGTNERAQDVLSRVLHGARPTLLIGGLSGIILISLGTLVGVTAGYSGGRTDSMLMRFTDVFYSIPLLPAVLVFVALFELGLMGTIVVIGFVLWRSSARVLRSQVLQIKSRPFVMAAKASGAGPIRTVFKHILPNIMPMIVLFFSIGVGVSIVLEAGLSFLGVTDPFTPTWGLMVRNVFNSGYVSEAWWWTLPPALMIGTTVLATFMFGRSYETLTYGDEEENVVVVE